MAGTSLLTLIDDVATLLDDVAAMTKIAGKKTAGVLGDDLALNAEQVTGFTPDRELPVVWGVFKGSLINKAILVPVALVISSLLPVVVTPLLMLGGLFLCFEGTEKVLEKLFHGKPTGHEDGHGHDTDERGEPAKATPKKPIDPAEYEKKKVRGAIRTDFILSAEVIVLALGTVTGQELPVRIGVVTIIAFAMSVVVYGLVAGIVKLDDAGLYLAKGEGARKRFGEFLIDATPYLMKGLGILGTIAMFLVGGGIVVHGIAPLHHWVEHLVHELEHGSGFAHAMAYVVPAATNMGVGIACGLVLVGVLTVVNKIRGVEAHH